MKKVKLANGTDLLLGLKNWDGFDFSSDIGYLSINQLLYQK
jgi:hypothetical protein